MPNDNLSCASTGSGIPPASGREQKPVKIRAILFYDGSEGTSPAAVPQLERILAADRRQHPEFDRCLAVYSGGAGAIGLDVAHSNDPAAAAETAGASGRIALGVQALGRNIINADLPDRHIDYLTIVTCGMPESAIETGIPQLLERESRMLKAQLETAGFTLHRVEIRFAGMFDTLAALEAALARPRRHAEPKPAAEQSPLERPLVMLRNE